MLQLASREHLGNSETRAHGHCSRDRVSDPDHPRERLGSDQQRAAALRELCVRNRGIRWTEVADARLALADHRTARAC